MRSRHLRRSLVALLMLALASTWQLAPSFAAEPCRMTEAAATVAAAAANHCAQVAGDCMDATVCCQAAPNLLVPQQAVAGPVVSHRVFYLGTARVLVGLRLPPDLHPPTVLA